MPTTAIPSRGPLSGSCSLISCVLLQISPSGAPLLARAPPPQLFDRLSLAVEGPPLARRSYRLGRDRRDRRDRLAAPDLQGLGKAPDGRVAEHLDDRDLAVERLAQPRLDLDEQQRASTQLEEVVVDTDAVVPEHVLPDRGERLLVRRPRRSVGAVQAQPAGVRRRQ